MPKLTKELKAVDVSRLTTPSLHFVGVVRGLALQVTPTGARSWTLWAIIGKKRRDMGRVPTHRSRWPLRTPKRVRPAS